MLNARMLGLIPDVIQKLVPAQMEVFAPSIATFIFYLWWGQFME